MISLCISLLHLLSHFVPKIIWIKTHWNSIINHHLSMRAHVYCCTPSCPLASYGILYALLNSALYWWLLILYPRVCPYMSCICPPNPSICICAILAIIDASVLGSNNQCQWCNRCYYFICIIIINDTKYSPLLLGTSDNLNPRLVSTVLIYTTVCLSSMITPSFRIGVGM